MAANAHFLAVKGSLTCIVQPLSATQHNVNSAVARPACTTYFGFHRGFVTRH